MMRLIIILTCFCSITCEFISSIPCESLDNKKLICRRTSFINRNLPFTNKSFYSEINHIEWIESGPYILSSHSFDTFSNVKNVSLRSNSITTLSTLPFWSHLKHVSYLDLSQNRLVSLNVHDFQLFHKLISLNISLNFLTTVEPIWLSIPLHIIDLSGNGINTIGYSKIQNATSEIKPCLLEQIYVNQNRGLLSFSHLKINIMDFCPFIIRFQLINNHWHCTCNDIINSLKYYRTLHFTDDIAKSLSGHCETPLSYRNIDIKNMNEELVCNPLVLLDSTENDDQSESSPFFSRQIICLFLLGCIIGLLIGICLHYCAHRCYDVFFYILFKCDRQKTANDRNPAEAIQMADRNDYQYRQNHFIYCPSAQSDSLPTYSQVMNDIFYLDVINRIQNNEIEGDC